MAIVLSTTLLQSAGFPHAFSTRDATFEQIARALGVGPEHVRRVKQVHSARVIVAGNEPTESTEADALVSRAEEAVAVQTADCVPILVGDRVTGAVAAIHAGWRGVVSGIVPNAIEMLARNREDLVAAIGPCIGACCFEVGEDVAEKIAASSGAAVVARRAGAKAFVDLRLATRIQLTRAGIANARIEDVVRCTYCETDLFFSYRRDGANAGRLVSAIAPR
ncbi:MAG: peptidoglycan editing factor PgeF [Polyangiaceae bacterium]